jgi:hypothetical protein
MVDRIEEYEASDIGVGITVAGPGVLTLITDRGRLVVHLHRRTLQHLAARITRELKRVPPPSRKLKDA